MPATKVTSSELNPSKTVDANGWTVYDYGTFKQYRKKGATQTSIGGGSWNNVNVTPNMPVGMSSLGANFMEASVSANDAAISCNLGADSSATAVNVQVSNQYGGAVNNFWLYWSITITTA